MIPKNLYVSREKTTLEIGGKMAQKQCCVYYNQVYGLLWKSSAHFVHFLCTKYEAKDIADPSSMFDACLI